MGRGQTVSIFHSVSFLRFDNNISISFPLDTYLRILGQKKKTAAQVLIPASVTACRRDGWGEVRGQSAIEEDDSSS